MERIEIKPDVMPFLSDLAQREGKSLTDVLDDLLRSCIVNTNNERTKIPKCQNCKNEVDYEINHSAGYCDYCESIVFLDSC